MLKQVVIDVFHTAKFVMWQLFCRRKKIRMFTIKTIDVTNEFKIGDPFVDAQ